jgi:RHS repeat-associated protein
MNDLPIATIRPKGANASTPLGITGTGAATANNLGTNTAANPVNVDFFYVHPDHLGTPRVVTKPADNKKVWEWQSQPFGEGAANENPQNLTGAALTAGQFRYNLRFPGQVYDAETAKHYNYFRDYDPNLGRYLESDPIGLRGDITTYGYVRALPTRLIDPLGLASCEGTWQFIGQNPTLPRVLRRCVCYWLCMPCRGSTAWSGNMTALPTTHGYVTYDPNQGGQDRGDVEGGNSCLCMPPSSVKCPPVCYR